MTDLSEQIDWDKTGNLIPAIVQDAATARVLMLGYMDRAALAQTQKSGLVTFYSRTKERLWTKGETSGHTLALSSIRLDCDNDTLLITAKPNGPTCHTGDETCFGEASVPDFGFLGTLADIIKERASADPEKSYVAKLLNKGLAKAAQKVGEEGVETALAAVLPSQEDFIDEASDLLFHLMILLHRKGVTLADIARNLEGRHKLRS